MVSAANGADVVGGGGLYVGKVLGARYFDLGGFNVGIEGLSGGLRLTHGIGHLLALGGGAIAGAHESGERKADECGLRFEEAHGKKQTGKRQAGKTVIWSDSYL